MYYLCVNLFNRQYTGLLYKKVSVTIWCSNNIPIVWSVYMLIFDSSAVWGPPFQRLVVFTPFSFSSVLSSVEIVHAFKLFFLFFFPLPGLGLVCDCYECLSKQDGFFFALSPDPQTSSLFTLVAGLLNVQKEYWILYFLCYEILSNIMSYSRIRFFFQC